jgi:hypothetical protein
MGQKHKHELSNTPTPFARQAMTDDLAVTPFCCVVPPEPAELVELADGLQ